MRAPRKRNKRTKARKPLPSPVADPNPDPAGPLTAAGWERWTGFPDEGLLAKINATHLRVEVWERAGPAGGRSHFRRNGLHQQRRLVGQPAMVRALAPRSIHRCSPDFRPGVCPGAEAAVTAAGSGASVPTPALLNGSLPGWRTRSAVRLFPTPRLGKTRQAGLCLRSLAGNRVFIASL